MLQAAMCAAPYVVFTLSLTSCKTAPVSDPLCQRLLYETNTLRAFFCRRGLPPAPTAEDAVGRSAEAAAVDYLPEESHYTSTRDRRHRPNAHGMFDITSR
jgi:hypothetical protein